jgi:hypothetical protein
LGNMPISVEVWSDRDWAQQEMKKDTVPSDDVSTVSAAGNSDNQTVKPG